MALVSLPLRSLHDSHVSVNDDREIKKYKYGVASNDMMFIPSFMQIHPLFQELLGWDRQTDIRTCMHARARAHAHTDMISSAYPFS
jgi:hypothetical protein